MPRWPAAEAPPGRLEDIVGSTVTLLEQNAALIEAGRPRVPLDRCGYLCTTCCRPRELDLARLLVGTEGTLGLFTEATLRTLPLPGGRAVVLLAFARLDAALRAARLAVATAPTACELLDRRLLRLARGDAGRRRLVPEGAEAVLLVEYEADTPAAAARRGRRPGRLALPRRAAGGAGARRPRRGRSASGFWQLCRAAWPSLSACAARPSRCRRRGRRRAARGAAGLPAARAGRPAAAGDRRRRS